MGVILFSRERRFLRAAIEVAEARLRALAPEIDLEVIERHLRTFEQICDGDPRGGPVAALPAPERFHWLVAPRSTIIQTSPVHVGRSDNPDQALASLLETQVRLPRPAQAAVEPVNEGA